MRPTRLRERCGWWYAGRETLTHSIVSTPVCRRPTSASCARTSPIWFGSFMHTLTCTHTHMHTHSLDANPLPCNHTHTHMHPHTQYTHRHRFIQMQSQAHAHSSCPLTPGSQDDHVFPRAIHSQPRTICAGTNTHEHVCPPPQPPPPPPPQVQALYRPDNFSNLLQENKRSTQQRRKAQVCPGQMGWSCGVAVDGLWLLARKHY